MIPASLFIIIIPLVAALPAYILRRWRSIEVLIAMVACALVIGILSRPVDSTISLPGLSIQIGAPVNLLGRVLAVRAADRLPLLLLFASGMLLFMASWAVAQGWTFIPLGLGILSLLSTGLLIRPFVFAALAFEAAAALAAIMIQAERNGERSTTGAMRYLVLSTLALPAFLGAGYAVSQAANITDPTLQAAAYDPAVILLSVGFGLLLGAFPLFTWIHAAAKDAPPLATAFLGTVASGAATFLFLSMKEDFTWFRASPALHNVVNMLGIATLLLACFAGWAQRSFGRIIACGLGVELGSTLLLLGSETQLSIEAIAFGVLARAFSLGLMGAGVAMLREQSGSDEFNDLSGLGRQRLWAALAVALGGVSLVGLPGTIGFVSRWASVRVLGQNDLEVVVLTLVAGASVGIGLIRGLQSLFTLPSLGGTEPAPPAPRRVAMTVALATLLVIVLGIAPGVTAPITKSIAENYTFYK
jgi:multicomponent Na+:H+ antiporter subunit D